MQLYELQKLADSIIKINRRLDNIEKQLSKLSTQANASQITHNIVVSTQSNDIDEWLDSIEKQLQQRQNVTKLL